MCANSIWNKIAYRIGHQWYWISSSHFNEMKTNATKHIWSHLRVECLILYGVQCSFIYTPYDIQTTHIGTYKSKIKIMKNNWNQLDRITTIATTTKTTAAAAATTMATIMTTTATRNVNVQHYPYSNSCSITHTHTNSLSLSLSVFFVTLNKKRKQTNTTQCYRPRCVEHFGEVHMYKFIKWEERRKRERA